ncbi:MAG TPA: tautomerase family protein [Gemmatimonadales bacterium]|jgi:phenylpyruvate tautomerase PptA (4-oxalocrotonate tautomerase family)|nr:tautomerase family protein [Gemmatimonadales bacterium]
MPLVRIDLPDTYPAAVRATIGDCVHTAMVETIGIPAADRFQVITAHPAGALVADPAYLDIQRSAAVVFVQVTLNSGRTVAQKKALYARIAELVRARAGVRPEDVLVNLVEVPKENWSFGGGIAQYAD